MKTFISFAKAFETLLLTIVNCQAIHARWVNTLSYLENCGARKIAACEHPTFVKEEMLKHAAEEFRHAYYLKQQIARIGYTEIIEDYSLANLLGGTSSLQYLNSLDLRICRYLAQQKTINKQQIKKIAYLLVTYAIEIRAGELYPLYDQVLRQCQSSVKVKSIVLEEKEHLEDMKKAIEKIPGANIYAEQACRIEGEICQQWLENMEKHLAILISDKSALKVGI